MISHHSATRIWKIVQSFINRVYCIITYRGTLDVVFRQIEIVLKDSTAFVYVTQSEKSSHFTLMT